MRSLLGYRRHLPCRFDLLLEFGYLGLQFLPALAGHPCAPHPEAGQQQDDCRDTLLPNEVREGWRKGREGEAFSGATERPERHVRVIIDPTADLVQPCLHL